MERRGGEGRRERREEGSEVGEKGKVGEREEKMGRNYIYIYTTPCGIQVPTTI